MPRAPLSPALLLFPASPCRPRSTLSKGLSELPSAVREVQRVHTVRYGTDCRNLDRSHPGTITPFLQADARIERELTALHEFMHDKRVTKKLRHEITSIYEHRLQLTKYDEREVISKLRPGHACALRPWHYHPQLNVAKRLD